jgi:hypothetical protein
MLTGAVNPKKLVVINRQLDNIVCQIGTTCSKIPNKTQNSSKLIVILIVNEKHLNVFLMEVFTNNSK